MLVFINLMEQIFIVSSSQLLTESFERGKKGTYVNVCSALNMHEAAAAAAN